MEAKEKRPVGRPARDPFKEQKELVAGVQHIIDSVKLAKGNAKNMIQDMRYIRAAFENLNTQPSMDETSLRLSGIASGRLYFAQHFFPEYMVAECDYMLSELNKLALYLESQTPAIRKGVQA